MREVPSTETGRARERLRECDSQSGPERQSRKPATNANGQSDRDIVPKKGANEGMTATGGRPKESLEGRNLAEGNSLGNGKGRTQCRTTPLSTGLQRIRESARKGKEVRYNSLMHHITVDLLNASYHKLNPKAAPGVDGMTWTEYGQGLVERVRALHEKVHGGRYRAKPARRRYIPKGEKEMRPLGIAALEDKIVQQAVVWILEQIYEEAFLGFSYGFRPGRSPHNALDALYMGVKVRKVNWILDADIRKFFDSIRHEWILKFLEHRIADRRMLRLIRKWLRAGVSEEGTWSETRIGTPQGAVISPMLANIYLHYVLDLWVQRWRKRNAKGDVVIVRYADDFVMGFQYATDAEAARRELAERLRGFGLTLHEEKTRVIEFGRYARERRVERGEGKPETFDFLGFTHMSGRSRKNGRFILQRQTSAKRWRAKIKDIRRNLLWHRHAPIPEQGRWLQSVLRGYYAYHGVPGNSRRLSALRRETARAWLHALRRRSQRGRAFNWTRMQGLVATWLPPVRLTHPYPDERLTV